MATVFSWNVEGAPAPVGSPPNPGSPQSVGPKGTIFGRLAGRQTGFVTVRDSRDIPTTPHVCSVTSTGDSNYSLSGVVSRSSAISRKKLTIRGG